MTEGELDPRSAGFVWPDHQPPFVALSAGDVAAYDRDGFFVLRDVLSADTVAAVTAAIDPFEAAAEDALRAQGGSFLIARVDEITFTTHLAQASDVLRAFVADDVFLGVVADLIGPDVRLYWDQAVYKKPDTTAHFPWHQDNGYAFIEPQSYVTCWIPLVDATEQNGCPWVVPGVHRRGTLAHHIEPYGLQCFDEPAGAIPVEVRAGDVVVFSSLTPHTTGPNLTDQVRKSYIVQFAPEGAAVLSTSGDGATIRTPADDPGRQFPVLVGGQAVPRA
jgi:ectoine hydroxylase-related dioxygenase (phytanoyl-CoA dioxygenase family)